MSINNQTIKLIYFKCLTCGSRVGIPEELLPPSYLKNKKNVNQYQQLYCNLCEDKKAHSYCGYKTVPK